MIPARYYKKQENSVKCLLCPHACVLREDATGICRTRKNIKGKLYSLAYGNPCALHIDPIEKKPLNHFLPGSTALSIATSGCNLRCLNCQNWDISQSSPAQHHDKNILPDDVVKLALEKNCNSIAYTYTDPVVFYEYMLDIAQVAHAKKVKNVLISAGYIEEEPLRELCKYLDAANIDLKGFDDQLYRKLNGVRLEPVLRTLQILKEEGVWLEITNLIIPQWTDDLSMFRKMCDWLVQQGFDEVPLHLSRFMPTHTLRDLYPTPVETLYEVAEIAKDTGIKYVYVGNVPGNPYQNTICSFCNQKLVDRTGYYVGEISMNNNRCINCNRVIAGVWE